ncbi:MAG: hypothetical protein DME22_09365 [Verrucomicrobia bacterium]|nr:MAG: hypothetical protein DME22_09365 [Verrucomicrobiota bacterium]
MRGYKRFAINALIWCVRLDLNQYACSMIEDIKRLVKSNPFKSFSIHLASGEVVVTSADTISISPKGDRINVFTSDGNFHLINAVQITELEVA